jgi:hypothetical protein
MSIVQQERIAQYAAKQEKSREMALDSFLAAHSEMGDLIEELKALHEDHYNADPDSVLWGNVGDLNHMISQMHELLGHNG